MTPRIKRAGPVGMTPSDRNSHRIASYDYPASAHISLREKLSRKYAVIGWAAAACVNPFGFFKGEFKRESDENSGAK